MGGGGGILLRGLAKAVTKPPVVGLAAASSSAVPQQSMVSSGSGGGAAIAGLPLRAAVASGLADDWVFAGDEERSEYLVRDHLVFGAAPSRDEVEEATSDLRNALSMCTGEPVMNSPASGTSSLSSIHRLANPVVDWIEPHLVCQEPGTFQVRRRNEVAEAFRLLQNDPVIQEAVMSIASDKAVWEAVLANDKVKEFRKKLSENGPQTFTSESRDESSEQSRPSPSDQPGLVDYLARLLDYSKSAYAGVKLMLANLLSSLFTFADSKFSDEFFDQAIKSSFILSVLVVALVVLKRASTTA